MTHVLVQHNEEWFTHTRFELRSNKTNQTWLIFEGATYDWVLGRAPYIVQWPDENARLLYAFFGQGDGCRFIRNFDNLTSFSVQTGKVYNFNPADMGDLAISPNNEFLAFSPFYSYIDEAKNFYFSVLSIQDQSVQTVQVDISGVSRLADFVWASDSSSFVFVADSDECVNDSARAIFQVEFPQLEVNMLRDFEERLLIPIELWEDGLVLQEEYYDDNDLPAAQIWLMNLTTGEFSPLQD